MTERGECNDGVVDEDKELLRRRLELLQREYERTALKLQRAERREVVRRHVRSRISEQNQSQPLPHLQAPPLKPNHSGKPSNLLGQGVDVLEGSPLLGSSPANSGSLGSLQTRVTAVRFQLPTLDPALSPKISPSHRLRSKRSRLRLAERCISRGIERERDRETSQGTERERDRENSQGIERERDRENSQGKERERDRENSQGKERERDRENSQGKERERDRENSQGKERERDRENSQGKERERDRENSQGKERERDRENSQGKERERDRENSQGKERERDRENSQGKEREQDRENSQGIERRRDGETDQKKKRKRAGERREEVEDRDTRGKRSRSESQSHATELSASVLEDQSHATELSASVLEDQSHATELSASVLEDQSHATELSASVLEDQSHATELSASVLEDQSHATELSVSVLEDQSHATELSVSVLEDQSRATEFSPAVLEDQSNSTELSAGVLGNQSRRTQLESQSHWSVTPSDTQPRGDTQPVVTPASSVDQSEPAITPAASVDQSEPVVTPASSVDQSKPAIMPAISVDQSDPVVTPVRHPLNGAITAYSQSKGETQENDSQSKGRMQTIQWEGEVCGPSQWEGSCTLVEGLLFPVEYYVRTTRRMANSQSPLDLQAVIHSQLSRGRGRRRCGQSLFSVTTSGAATEASPLEIEPIRAEVSSLQPVSQPITAEEKTKSRPVRARRRRRGAGWGRRPRRSRIPSPKWTSEDSDVESLPQSQPIMAGRQTVTRPQTNSEPITAHDHGETHSQPHSEPIRAEGSAVTHPQPHSELIRAEGSTVIHPQPHSEPIRAEGSAVTHPQPHSELIRAEDSTVIHPQPHSEPIRAEGSAVTRPQAHDHVESQPLPQQKPLLLPEVYPIFRRGCGQKRKLTHTDKGDASPRQPSLCSLTDVLKAEDHGSLRSLLLTFDLQDFHLPDDEFGHLKLEKLRPLPTGLESYSPQHCGLNMHHSNRRRGNKTLPDNGTPCDSLPCKSPLLDPPSEDCDWFSPDPLLLSPTPTGSEMLCRPQQCSQSAKSDVDLDQSQAQKDLQPIAGSTDIRDQSERQSGAMGRVDDHFQTVGWITDQSERQADTPDQSERQADTPDQSERQANTPDQSERQGSSLAPRRLALTDLDMHTDTHTQTDTHSDTHTLTNTHNTLGTLTDTHNALDAHTLRDTHSALDTHNTLHTHRLTHTHNVSDAHILAHTHSDMHTSTVPHSNTKTHTHTGTLTDSYPHRGASTPQRAHTHTHSLLNLSLSLTSHTQRGHDPDLPSLGPTPFSPPRPHPSLSLSVLRPDNSPSVPPSLRPSPSPLRPPSAPPSLRPSPSPHSLRSPLCPPSAPPSPRPSLSPRPSRSHTFSLSHSPTHTPAADWSAEPPRGGANSPVPDPTITSTKQSKAGTSRDENQMTGGTKTEKNHITIGTKTEKNHITIGTKTEKNHITIGTKTEKNHMPLGATTNENHNMMGTNTVKNLPGTWTDENQTTCSTNVEENLMETSVGLEQRQSGTSRTVPEQPITMHQPTHAASSLVDHIGEPSFTDSSLVDHAHELFPTDSLLVDHAQDSFQTGFLLADDGCGPAAAGSSLVEYVPESVHSGPSLASCSEGSQTSVLQRTHTLKGAVEGCVYDVCVARSSLGGQLVCVAGEGSVCVWTQDTPLYWSLLHTWRFTQSVVSLFSVPDSDGLLCVTLGQLEITEIRILSTGSFSERAVCEGACLRTVVGVSLCRLVCGHTPQTKQSIEVNTLTKDGSVKESVRLLSSDWRVESLVAVENQTDALIGWTDSSALLIWNMKTGHLLQTIQLGHMVSTATCLRGYSCKGVVCVLLESVCVSGENPEGVCVFTLLCLNPMTGKAAQLTTLNTHSSERFVELDVIGPAVVGVSSSGHMVLWDMRGGSIRSVVGGVSDDWHLARWAGSNTLLAGQKNGDVCVYQYTPV